MKMPQRSGAARDGDHARPDSTPQHRGKFASGLFTTLPIVLASSMAIGFGATAPVQQAQPPRPDRHRDSPSELTRNIRAALAAAHAASSAQAVGDSSAQMATAGAAPTTYVVRSGDTVSGIAGRYGLATASVLALNGLGWKSMIHPGQVLSLASGTRTPIAAAPAPAPAPSSSRYKILAGDTISKIAAKFGVSTQSLLSANGLGWSSTIYAGSTLAIPGTAAPAGTGARPIAQPAPVPVAFVTPAPVSTAARSHVIKAGETVASIAKAYGVTIQSILTANGLGWSSIIYGGKNLAIPGIQPVSPTPSGVMALDPEMAKNASIIISVGKSLGVGDFGLVIALSTAMQESSLRNLNYGDRDSLGLFQQRPSTGWGTPAQVTDPVYAARLFFGGVTNPNAGLTRGLLDIPGWQSMTVTRAAQSVQRSAFPDAYAKWETSARVWLDQLT